jgi:tetratricopeptide (TPR) repeat protein
MAYTSEIEKLERRNAENPLGRLFAPLADAYRKQGELERAMTLLREGLERHPDYIGAQIVLGRCHLDLGDESEASGAFQRVLDLDGENVIALKALADIADRGGRRDEAVSRLERLLEIDRGNEEAAAQLEALRARPAAASVETAEPEPDDAPMAPPAGIELTSGFGAEGVAAGVGAEPPPVADLQIMEASAEVDDVVPLEGLEIPELGGEEFFLEREADILLEGSAENEFQSRSDAERLAAPEMAAPNPWQDLAAEPVPAAREAEPPMSLIEPEEGGEEVAALEEAEELEDEEFVTLEPPTLEELGDATAEEPGPVAEDVAGAGEPELVVTETMAAVYERQGLRHEALTIYRELAARRPDDGRLAAKVAELEAAAPPPPTAPPPVPMQAAEPPTRHPAGYAAAESGGQSLGAFLRGVLGARLAGPGSAAVPAGRQELAEAGMDAAPTRPAADPVSLSAVFGDDLPPATPAASQSVPSAGQGFSFDAFFGASGAPAREGARPSAGGEDDLEQFHAWLQGLKK